MKVVDEILRKRNSDQLKLALCPLGKERARKDLRHDPTDAECIMWFAEGRASRLYALMPDVLSIPNGTAQFFQRLA